MKSFFCYIIVLSITLCLSGCTDDYVGNYSSGFDEPEIRLSVGAFPTVNTRASFNEDDVKSVWIGIYDADTEQRLQYFTFPVNELTSETEGYSKRLRINSDVKASGKRIVYIVANRSVDDDKSSTVGGLKSISDDSSASDMAMWASSEELDSYKEMRNLTFNLIRNRGKFSARVEPGSEADKGQFKLTEFFIINGVNSGSVVNPTPVKGDKDLSSTEVVYSFPALNSDGSVSVVFKGGYGSDADYYYHAELKKDDKFLNIEQNTHYELLITDAESIGYTSLEQAKVARPNTTVVIKDHRPMIFSMISDGSRELGVTDTIYWTGDNRDFWDFKIRISDKDFSSGSSASDQKSSIKVSSGNDWIHDPVISDEGIVNEDGTDGDNVRFFEYTCKIKIDSNEGGNRERDT